MSLSFDQKKDFRLRMADLEKKLAESEDERSKLEKTCNVLMRAFREEEKMQYVALNKRYEKFLEDCVLRKRRNDIILRSLSRIEDRTKALFAKTERLKLLKDRYISYLKINYVKNEEVGVQTSRNFTAPSQNVTKDVTYSVKWTTPVETPKAVTFREIGGNLRIGSPISSDIRDTWVEGGYERVKSQELEIKQDWYNVTERNVFNRISSTEEPRTAAAHNIRNSVDTPVGYQDTSPILKSFPRENEGLTDSVLEVGDSVSEKHVSSDKFKSFRGSSSPRNEKTVDAMEKLKKAFEKSERYDVIFEGKIKEEEEEDVQKKKSQDVVSPERNHNFVMPKSTKDLENKELKMTTDFQEESDGLKKNWKPLPKGLDGVDYQNETYPESYYEQPIHHHNHTSIASDVILEEDETEQDVDEGMKEFGSDESETNSDFLQKEKNNETNTNFLESRDVDEQKSEEPKEIEELRNDGINEKVCGKVKNLDSDSEINLEGKQSEDKNDKSEKLAIETSNKSKMAAKSNLSHLLESDSESFQIEHGDAASGNEDSDFDFSFHQK